MTHPVLRTSTALCLSLTMLQPGIAPAQEAAIDPDLRALCAATPEAAACAALPEEVRQRIQEEATPVGPGSTGAAPDDGIAPPGADPEPAPEALQEAPAEIVPGSAPPALRPEPRPEPETETEPRPTGAAPSEDASGGPSTAGGIGGGVTAVPDAAAPEATVPDEPEPATEALDEGLDALDPVGRATDDPEATAPPRADPDPNAAAEPGRATETPPGPAAPTSQPAPAPDAATPAPETADPSPAPATETEAASSQPAPGTDPAAADPSAPSGGDPATGGLSDDPGASPQERPATGTGPDEEPLAPLDAEQEAAVRAMTADPEVAEALTVLERTIAADDATGAGAEAGGEAEAGVPAAARAVESLLADPAGLAETDAREVTEEMSRTSAEDVAEPVTLAAPTQARPPDRDGLTDFEQIGLGALAGLVVGMSVAGNRVAATAPDRVVVVDDQGDYDIWRDDDALLRRPGVRDRIERFDDGSTATTIFRQDGARIVTVRDATGRAIRRDRIAPDGRVVTLFDDTRQVAPVRVSTLPPPRRTEIPAVDAADPDLLREVLAQTVPQDVAGRFSLSQVRSIVQVRRLAPELAVGPVTFATGSAAIRPEQAERLAIMAGVMADIIALDPTEIFLIEGHTDAVGRRAYNLLLSDRRAESVALALTEYFGVPPENMVVQGYGERFLRVPTATAEPRNRRVTVRRITDLIQ